MEGRFSRPVREAVAYSRLEAIRLGDAAIRPVHLLLGALRVGAGAVRVLEALGCAPGRVRASVERLAGGGGMSFRRGHLPLTREAERVLKEAYLEARDAGRAAIGTEHLLLSLLRDERRPVAALLRETCSLTRARVLQKVRELGLEEEETVSSVRSGWRDVLRRFWRR